MAGMVGMQIRKGNDFEVGDSQKNCNQAQNFRSLHDTEGDELP